MKKNIRKHIFAVLCLMVTILFVTGLLVNMNSGGIPVERIDLKDEWTFTRNDEVKENVKLSELTFPVTQKGDVVTLSKVLPQGSEYASLEVWMCHSAIDAYLNGELFYTYGHDKLERGELVGSGFYFMELPVDYAGKELKIVFSVGEQDAFSSIEPISLESSNTIFTTFLHEKFMFIVIGVFLMVTGLAGLCVISFFVMYVKEFKRLLYIFMTAAFLGIWTLCNNGIMQMFSQNYVFPQFLEFSMFFLTPIPLLLFMQDIVKDKKRLYLAMKIVQALIIAFDLVVFTLVGFEVIHFQKVMGIYHLLLVAVIVLLAMSVVVCSMRRRRSELYIVVGCSFMVIGALLDLASFNLRKYAQMRLLYVDYGTVLGALILVICMIVSYFSYIKDLIISETKSDVLTKLAYHDNLTGLYNRVKFDECLRQVQQTQMQYAVLSFELSGTQMDAYMKQFGNNDEYLKECAIGLKTVFAQNGRIARVAGNEMAVLVTDATKEKVMFLVKNFQNYCKMHNEKSKIRLETSMGVAFRKEVLNDDCQSVYQLANARMHDMEKQMHRIRTNAKLV